MMDLKEFDKFLKICRKQGITEVIYQDISVKFGEMPKKDFAEEELNDADLGLTEDQLIFYHTQQMNG